MSLVSILINCFAATEFNFLMFFSRTICLYVNCIAQVRNHVIFSGFLFGKVV